MNHHAIMFSLNIYVTKNAHILNMLQRKEINDFKYPRQLIVNEKWNSVMITKNSDEYA